MSGGYLTPDTTMALMQASEGQGKQALKNLKDTRNLEKIEHAAKEFESVFLAEMLKPLFEGIETEAPFGGGKGEEIFRGMMIQEYGKIFAETGTVGIADSVKQELIKIQETQK